MIELITLFSYALVLGLLHALEGDHIAAVGTLATDSKRSTYLGLFWGIGHTITLLVVGSLVLALGMTLPESFSSFFELLIGALLVFLGASVIVKVRKDKLHIHTHDHDGEEHVHLHSHKKSVFHKHEHKSFLFGLFHGLAGSGALLLLILPAANSILEGIIFIAVFGFGSVVGMTGVSFALGHLMQRLSHVAHYIKLSAGVLSVLVGFVFVVGVVA